MYSEKFNHLLLRMNKYEPIRIKMGTKKKVQVTIMSSTIWGSDLELYFWNWADIVKEPLYAFSYNFPKRPK